MRKYTKANGVKVTTDGEYIHIERPAPKTNPPKLNIDLANGSSLSRISSPNFDIITDENGINQNSYKVKFEKLQEKFELLQKKYDLALEELAASSFECPLIDTDCPCSSDGSCDVSKSWNIQFERMIEDII